MTLEMQRIFVMGCSGSGKTTFACDLRALTGHPLISLDALHWQPGWQAPEPAAVRKRVANAMRQPVWIMDGNYISNVGDLRKGAADTIFFFDLPRQVCMTGVLKRVATSYGKTRPEMAPGCPERLDWPFLKYVWNYNRHHRQKNLDWIMTQSPPAQVHVFASHRQSAAYLAGIPAACGRTAS